jgi:hypothetical protein
LKQARFRERSMDPKAGERDGAVFCGLTFELSCPRRRAL